jgi:predicted dithiol-disulfide oxidoreductase (DUF899 family)
MDGTSQGGLVSAKELASRNDYRFANDSAAYRRARNDLLAEEIELRRHIERVAEMRRALPPGGEVTEEYNFIGEGGPVGFRDLFADKHTLVVYSFMYGRTRERPCPMCTSLLDSLNGEAASIEQRVALAVVARSLIERLVKFKDERGWDWLKLYEDVDDRFSRDHYAIAPDGGDYAGIHVFTRAPEKNGSIRHFWSGEAGFDTADPDQDPRMAPDLMPMWNIFDLTPEGRHPTWYPKLEDRDG